MGALTATVLLLSVPPGSLAAKAHPDPTHLTHLGVCSWLTKRGISDYIGVVYNNSAQFFNLSKLPSVSQFSTTLFHAWKRVCSSPLTRSVFKTHGIYDFSVEVSLYPKTGAAYASFVETWSAPHFRSPEVYWFVSGWTGAISGPYRI